MRTIFTLIMPHSHATANPTIMQPRADTNMSCNTTMSCHETVVQHKHFVRHTFHATQPHRDAFRSCYTTVS
jgi:hypothetical protein